MAGAVRRREAEVKSGTALALNLLHLVHLVRGGTIALSLVENLRSAIPQSLNVACQILPFPSRPQAPPITPNASSFIHRRSERIESLARPRDWRLLAIADVDLYIPILQYVFGEARMGGPCALGSTFRLRQDFYGFGARRSVAESETAQGMCSRAGTHSRPRSLPALPV
jgi:hypothetical protein